MSIAGFLTGFIFSMPIAGPVSIMITSNALKGRLRYCNLFNLGASFGDFIYVFIAVFGLTKLYTFYKPIIPYIFSFGALLLIFLGYKIFRTKFDIEHLEDKIHLSDNIKKKERGAFYTGFMINFLNPTLFIGVLTSSFFVISLIAALGLNTGGLAGKMNQEVKEISNMQGIKIDNSKVLSITKFDNMQIAKNRDHDTDQTKYHAYFHLIISICYAFFLSVGTLTWFLLMTYLLIRFRQRINLKVITGFIKSLGIILCIFGLYFGYLAIKIGISS
jgi:threonine/homoserine/homoserine lactone efflux protein